MIMRGGAIAAAEQILNRRAECTRDADEHRERWVRGALLEAAQRRLCNPESRSSFVDRPATLLAQRADTFANATREPREIRHVAMVYSADARHGSEALNGRVAPLVNDPRPPAASA